ncbi:MAG: hypothetical protein LBL90_03390 [Prevotellaceae bacterium]|jgi:hypothetical protein|nr:hypothetical protein [Prevotellaceae bacterium]
MKKIYLFFIFIIISFASHGQTFTTEQLKADLDSLYVDIYRTNFDMFARIPKETFDAEFEKIKQSINRALEFV